MQSTSPDEKAEGHTGGSKGQLKADDVPGKRVGLEFVAGPWDG